MLDARGSLRYGKFNINDYHAQRRVLTLPEVFTYSSNIGTAKMALGMGVEHHKWFLKKMGQLDRLTTELPESAMPLVPKRWGELNTITIAFGHGLSVAPLQATMAVGALMNGGSMIPPTFLKRSEEEAKKLAVQVIKPETSALMRYLMRLNAEKGSARKADVPGYLCRRQDRHGREGRQRPLFQDQAAHHLHGGAAGRQAALSRSPSCSTSRRACPRRTASPPRAGTRRRPPPRSSRASRRCSGSNRASTCRRPIS